MNYSTDFKSIRNGVSAQEWQTRLDLAACYRLVDAYGMTDLIYNHITARIPGTEHLLINLYGLLYREITASSLVKIDVEGNIVSKPDTDYGINVSGYVIHGAIHKARPAVACVLHTHTRAGVAQILCLPRKGHRLDFGGRPRPLGLDPCSPTSSGFICLARIHGGNSVNSRSSLTIANKSRQLRVAKLEPFAHPAGRIRADTME